ncbi:MAG: SixA phosphatase family protein [Candidatus Binatia bacterium]
MIPTLDTGFTRLQNSLHAYRSQLIGPLLLLSLVLASMGCAVSSRPSEGDRLSLPRQVFLVRHTEREWEGEDPPLVAAGEARAQALAETLRDAGITRIVTTQWRRTRDTAQPLAKLLKITPQVIPVLEGKARENVEEVAAAVSRYQDETVLIVGHITVTGVIAALGGPRLPTICDNVFSDLFLFTPAAGDAGLLHLHYGAAEDISPRCRISRPVD